MNGWEKVVAIIADELSGLDDLQSLVRMIIRLFCAIVLGGVLGYERERQGKAAGLRTHMLVCLGATLFILSGGATGVVDDAMSRIIQGVIAGVGFLCAGTIIKNTVDVRGLTTAAGVWFTAAVGVMVGLGHIALAILATLMALVVLHCLPSVPEQTSHSDD